MMIRSALAAPPFFNLLPGVAAAVFAILQTIVNRKRIRNKSFQDY